MSKYKMVQCKFCREQAAHEISQTREVDYMGHHLVIDDDRIMHCDACGEEYYQGAQIKLADRRLVDARRKAEGLLTADAIKRIRHSFSLSQQQFESALGLGVKTIVRLENDTAVQSKALDDVLRLIELDPDNLYLLSLLREAPMPTDFHLDSTPQRQQHLGALEAAIYARIEATDMVGQEIVRQITRAAVLAYEDFKKQQIEQVLSEKRTAIA